MIINPEITVDSIRGMLAGIGPTFPEVLQIEVLAIDDERSVGAIAVEERHLHPGRLVHGGVWVGLAYTVAAWQTFRHIPSGANFTTIELKLNAFGAGRLGDRLTATATHLHEGRSTHVIEVRVERAGGDGEPKLAANLIVTQFVIPAA
ncbi:MAG: PaaI family thioesterase [Solirubrobacterales bacterium]